MVESFGTNLLLLPLLLSWLPFLLRLLLPFDLPPVAVTAVGTGDGAAGAGAGAELIIITNSLRLSLMLGACIFASSHAQSVLWSCSRA